MFSRTSTDTDDNTHSGGKISSDIVAIFAVLLTMIILPPFIIAGTILYRNRRRPKRTTSIFHPTISKPTLESNSLCYNGRSNAFRHVSLTPVSAPSNTFKSVPQLPHPTTKPSYVPSSSVPPRSSSLQPPSLNRHPHSRNRPYPRIPLPPRLPQTQFKPLHIPTKPTTQAPSLVHPDHKTWRTSNPPSSLPASTRNLMKNNPHNSIISIVSQSSSTYADVDLSDSIPNISPLSPPVSPRLYFRSVLHPPTPVLSPPPTDTTSANIPTSDDAKDTNVNPNHQHTHLHPGSGRPNTHRRRSRQSTYELRPLGTRVMRDMRGLGSDVKWTTTTATTNKGGDKDNDEDRVRFKDEEGDVRLDANTEAQTQELYFDFVKK